MGYRFSPQLADVGGACFWRVDPAADYSALNGVARHRINTGLIARHWDDLLRLAGSLKLGRVMAFVQFGPRYLQLPMVRQPSQASSFSTPPPSASKTSSSQRRSPGSQRRCASTRSSGVLRL